MRRYGYDPYHGRSRGRTALKIVIGVLLVLLVLAVAALLTAWMVGERVREGRRERGCR